ncbi:MAG: methyltransferase [Deltaproteobacteria bacterium]|nr:methyltransferase [Deltaproteobacteria bacterium]
MRAKPEIETCPASDKKNEILEYGVRAFRPRHHKIRELKRTHAASCHGFRLWPSSWLLMDFLNGQGLRKGARVMELGCGWGLAGIFCAKNRGAKVTSVDIDSEVFPYLRVHTQINHVNVSTMHLGFDDLISKHLKGIDVMIGADICFLDSLADSLRKLICRALGEGVQFVAIADPGRTSFERLGRHFAREMSGEVGCRSVQRPFPIEGRILRIGALSH